MESEAIGRENQVAWMVLYKISVYFIRYWGLFLIVLLIRRDFMEFDGNKIKEKAITAFSRLKDNMKGTFYDMAEIPYSSVQQLAEFIQMHPDTKISTKNLLGNTYTFFRLKTNDKHFYLETNNERILQMDGYLNGKEFVSYRSYRNDHLDTPIKLI